MQNETVKLHPAFAWDCPECEHSNFVRIRYKNVLCRGCEKSFKVIPETEDVTFVHSTGARIQYVFPNK